MIICQLFVVLKSENIYIIFKNIQTECKICASNQLRQVDEPGKAACTLPSKEKYINHIVDHKKTECVRLRFRSYTSAELIK